MFYRIPSGQSSTPSWTEIQPLDPKSTSFLQDGVVFHLGEIYECDSEDLRLELHQTRRLLQRKNQIGVEELSSTFEMTLFLEHHEDIFQKLFPLCGVAKALPVSNQACGLET